MSISFSKDAGLRSFENLASIPNPANVTFYLYNNALALLQKNVTGSLNRAFNYTAQADGLYYFNVSVNDTALNVNFTSTRSIRLDTLTPEVTSFATNDTDNIE